MLLPSEGGEEEKPELQWLENKEAWALFLLIFQFRRPDPLIQVGVPARSGWI